MHLVYKVHSGRIGLKFEIFKGSELLQYTTQGYSNWSLDFYGPR